MTRFYCHDIVCDELGNKYEVIAHETEMVDLLVIDSLDDTDGEVVEAHQNDLELLSRPLFTKIKVGFKNIFGR